MNRPSGTSFALHLRDRRDGPPEIRLSLSRPLIGPFPHVGGGGDRIDRDDLGELVSDISGGLIAVDGYLWTFHVH